MDQNQIEAIVQAVLNELKKKEAPAAPAASAPAPARPQGRKTDALIIDLPDPTAPERRNAIGVKNPMDLEGLHNLKSTTPARIGAGRAGPRPRTVSWLLFQADHGVTQDAIYGEVKQAVLDQFGLFTVQTMVKDKEEYLLRPDLGRKLTPEAKMLIDQKCVKKPQVQIVVGDGLSAAAINNNLPHIFPVIQQGLEASNISMGTPFFIKFARVGVINDVNTVIGADVVVILIGERPGLGVADAMSAYMGWRPGPGKSDAQRDVICMITNNGGLNPLEAGAYVVELIKKILKHQASGVELKLKTQEEITENPSSDVL
ncbi:MAG TPA: ethanolamine ammonia-lyase subunit EutC [Anaerolineae bacterium]|nr:ethanolamine ammonia-lyase subunit EutC [Caldilineae bacterium]HID35576.1 ethanolamine ammonia-lyase subunit EutC [Anaerolineae bacterium]